MTLRNLKIFCTLVETGSATAAAERLYISQPSVSVALRELESYYGVRLFERLGRRLVITPEGERFYGYAIHITRLFDELELGMKQPGEALPLRAGASITVGTRYMPRVIRLYGDGVKLFIAPSDEVEEGVVDGSLDCGIIEGAAHNPLIVAEKLFDDAIVPVCAPTHDFARAHTVAAAEFVKQPLLLRERGSGTRELLDNALNAMGLTAEPLWESVSTEALVEGVAQGFGISALPLGLVGGAIEAGRLATFVIAGLSLSRAILYIRHRDKFVGEALRKFEAAARSLSIPEP